MNNKIWSNKSLKRNSLEFIPQTKEIAECVAGNNDSRIIAIQGGEGSGKTTTGLHLVLNKLKQGMSGIIISPSIPYLKRKWDFMKNWVPEDVVIPEDRYKLEYEYEPITPFKINFYNEKGSTSNLFMYTQLSNMELLHLSWSWIDDGQAFLTKDTLGKVMSIARVTIDEKNPQVIVSYTPTAKYERFEDQDNWLYRCFADEEDKDDPLHFIKDLTYKIQLSPRWNIIKEY